MCLLYFYLLVLVVLKWFFSWEVRAFQWLQMCCSVSAPHSVSVLRCADARSLRSCWRWQWAEHSWWASVATCNLLLWCSAMLHSTECEGLQKALKTSEMLWIGACCYSCAMPLDSGLTFFLKLLTGAPFFPLKKKVIMIASSWAWTQKGKQEIGL